MVTLSVLIAHWEMSQWLFNVILLWFPSNAKFNQWRLHLLRELCLCSTPFSQCKFPQSSNSDQAQNDTCASCPAHVRMLKFTSKINRTLWGVSVLGPWLNTFLILPFKIDLNTLYLFLLCFLLFFLPSFLLSFLLHSESPSLFLPFLLPLFLSFAQHFSDLKCWKQRSWSNRLSMFAQLIKLTHNINTRNNCNTNISINIPTPG